MTTRNRTGWIVLLIVASLAVVGFSLADAQSTRARYIRDANDTVRSRHVLDAGIGGADLGTTVHTCDVVNGTAAVTSTINAASAGGKILGVYWAGNQDQFVDNIVLNANGSVTCTLAANATATNNLRVVVAHGVPRQ